jgi:hypothetical protein
MQTTGLKAETSEVFASLRLEAGDRCHTPGPELQFLLLVVQGPLELVECRYRDAFSLLPKLFEIASSEPQ